MNQEQIEAVWSELRIERIPGHDMSNECRLAAAILQMRESVKRHRDAKGHERCWENDEELWTEVLGAGTVDRQVPARAEFLARCEAYHEDQTKKRGTPHLVDVAISVTAGTDLETIECETGCGFTYVATIVEAVAQIEPKDVDRLVRELKQFQGRQARDRRWGEAMIPAGTEFTRCARCIGAEKLCPGCFVNERSIGKLRNELVALEERYASLEASGTCYEQRAGDTIQKLERTVKRLRARSKVLSAIELIVRKR